MKRAAAAVITIALLAAALWAGRQRQAATQYDAASPAACIQQMFAAAEQGDVAGYLGCFGGSQRARFERAVDAESGDEFAKSLVAAMADLKGRAVTIEMPDDGAAGACRATVERIYATRTERQTYRLRRENGVWRIHEVLQAAPRQPRKSYGTPVWE